MFKNNGTCPLCDAALQEAVSPVLECQIHPGEMIIILSEMYVNSVSNAPDDETESFTARRQGNVYLVLMRLLENLKAHY